MATFEITFPRELQGEVFEQGEEICEVALPDGTRRFRFHDYGDLYKVPGLYEQLFYDELECR